MREKHTRGQPAREHRPDERHTSQQGELRYRLTKYTTRLARQSSQDAAEHNEDNRRIRVGYTRASSSQEQRGLRTVVRGNVAKDALVVGLAVAVGVLLPIIEKDDGDGLGQELAFFLALVLPQSHSCQKMAQAQPSSHGNNCAAQIQQSSASRIFGTKQGKAQNRSVWSKACLYELGDSRQVLALTAHADDGPLLGLHPRMLIRAFVEHLP